MTPRILIIGLDAATMDLIEPWVAAGQLPALARLMREGAASRLLSTPNMHSASAWTSILTGLNPGRHGLYVFSDRDFATGKQVFFKGGDRVGETIGAHLARHGLTAGFLNVPMTYPAESLAGGYMISGLDAPELNERAFSPAGLRDEIFSKFPDYRFSPPGLGDLMSAGRIDEAISAWLRLTETQTAVARYLLETRPTDFFMTVYTASDWAGHNLWRYLKDDAPAERRGAMLSVYQALDRAVGELLKLTDERTQVYVISDHGMGPHTGASYHLAHWLEERGYMARRRNVEARTSILKAGRSAAKNLLPAGLKERIKSGLGGDRVKQLQAVEKDSFYSSIDWARTTAYSEPGRHVININLAGRNAEGIVAPDGYAATCERVIEDLMEWADATGERFVERVVKCDEVYKGPFAERASDLYIHWNPQADAGEPPPEVRARGYWWSGDHRPEGILICRGPGIRQTALNQFPTVYDLVPTVMYLAGLPVSEGLDGRVIEEVCSEDIRASRPVRFETAAASQETEADKLSQTDEELIEEKLRGLGYL